MVRGIGRAIVGVLAILIGCARSAVELDDVGGGGDVHDDGDGNGDAGGGRSGMPPTDDDDILGGTSAGGMPPTGGVGGSLGGQVMGGGGGAPTGGSGGNAGEPEPPFDPGGPIPNCRADPPVFLPTKDIHWLYLVARLTEQDPEGRYLVKLTPDGPQNVVHLSETGGFRGWSFDGRFMAFTRSAMDPYVIEVLDFSQGELPVPVPVPPRAGDLTWSRSDGRYALQYSEPSGLHRLVIGDATTSTEKIIEIPFDDQATTWSWDGRYVALYGPWAVLLFDTSGSELALQPILHEPSVGLVWSPDSRYFAFQAHHSEGSTDRLYVFDTELGTLEMLDEVPSGQGLGGFEWAGNSWLIRKFGERSYFIDIAVTPRVPAVLAEHTLRPTTPGFVSPGSKCFAFNGYCEAAGESGVCVRTLPPDPQKPAILVQRTVGSFPFWAGTGDQLLLMTGAEPRLINVELDGGDFTSQVVTAKTNVVDVSAPSWNPSGHSDWIKYSATEGSGKDRKFAPRLWHRERGDTYGFLFGDEFARGSAWSTDGRYLVFDFETTSGRPGVYFVQELIDSELGSSWTLEEPIPSGSLLWASYLQP